jgi:hypothetical protein
MAININGYNLSDSSGLVLGSSTSKIDSSGRVLVPNLPAMFGSKLGVGTAAQYPWAINSTTINVNSCWNGTVFTCPVAGLYFMSLGLLYSGAGAGGGGGYFGPVKNGVLQYFGYSNCSTDYWDTVNFSSIIACNAGDTLSWAVNVAPAPVGGGGAYGDNHNMSTIWFLG